MKHGIAQLECIRKKLGNMCLARRYDEECGSLKNLKQKKVNLVYNCAYS